MAFMGYERPDGSVGVRNHLLVIPVGQGIEPVARKIAGGKLTKAVIFGDDSFSVYFRDPRLDNLLRITSA